MVLAMSGCVFILGKLREGVKFAGEAASAKWTLITSSPGIVLALAGAVLIGLSLKVTIKVESEDKPVYLPQLAEIVGETAGGQAAPRGTPHALPAGAAGVQSGTKASLPTHLAEKLRPSDPDAKAPSHGETPGS
jgi:hypothetical protein